MDRLIEFVGNHPALSAAFVAIVALLIWHEIRNRASGVRAVSPAGAVALVNDEDAVFIDVREPAEVSGGHIGEATQIPLSSLSKRMDELSGLKGRTMIAYCRSGSRSMAACKQLRKAGFESVYNLTGGISAWQNADLPIGTGKKKKKSKTDNKNAG